MCVQVVCFLLRKNTVRRDAWEWYKNDVERYARFKDLFCMKGVDMWRFVCYWIAVLTVGMTTVADAEKWYFAGLSPGIVLEGKVEAAGHGFVGVDGVLWRFLGYGADVGYLAPWKALQHGVGVLSVGGLVFPVRRQNYGVFLSSGYTLGFRGYGQRANFLHTGLGMRLGARVRLELRNYVNFDGSDPNTYIWSFRLGVVF